jgi:hypothetical protein
MEKNSTPKWRLWALARLDVTLILFELTLSVIFISLSYLTGSLYIRGVGVGLIIAWVTSAIAYLYRKKAGSSGIRAPGDVTIG